MRMSLFRKFAFILLLPFIDCIRLSNISSGTLVLIILPHNQSSIFKPSHNSQSITSTPNNTSLKLQNTSLHSLHSSLPPLSHPSLTTTQLQNRRRIRLSALIDRTRISRRSHPRSRGRNRETRGGNEHDQI